MILRRYVLTSIVNIFMLLGLLFFLPAEAHACSCVPPPPPQEALEKHSAVFSGKVIKIKMPEEKEIMSSADPVHVLFNVKEVWKGEIEKQVGVSTAMSTASCGFHFESGGEYIVYASGEMDALKVSLCSRTALLFDAEEDLQSLGDGKVNPQYGEDDAEGFQEKDGTGQSEDMPTASDLTQTTSKSGNQTLIVTIAVIIIALLAGWGIFKFYRSKS